MQPVARVLNVVLLSGALAGVPVMAAPTQDQCLLCHGVRAQGNEAIGAPALNVLAPWYVTDQLRAYRAGQRGGDDEYGAVMQAVAAVLSDEQIVEVAEAVTAIDDHTALASAASQATVDAAASYPACAGCHGEDAGGNRALGAPALAGQNAWYLRKRMEAFVGAEDAVEDSNLLAMQASLSSLGGAQALDQLSQYLSSLPPAAQPDPISGQQESAKMNTPRVRAAAMLASTVLAAAPLAAQDVTRYPLPNGSTFPIALAVETSPGTTLIHHSGLTPRPVDPDAERFSKAYWGDTKTQAMSVFSRMEASLENLGVGFGDIIKMTVFLVGTEETGGRLDFAGFMEAYTQYFGTEEQPNLPARSAVQVAGLAAPGMLVEVEVIIARPE
ncbi:MAG: Rid family hydrolase [Pseudomonadota bacterium]